MQKWITVPALAVTAALALTGCGLGGESQKSAPDPVGITPAVSRVIQMPDGFRNVAWSCNGKVGIYVTSRGVYKVGSADYTALPSSIAVVNPDPNCP